ncbi:MAG TPA: hypothetical protein VE544_03450 [Nitrososphaeraceae archaeon]|jgi:hypothetical protein|nr:hypothetical protein [Nitrososphaeraceae archaeon]
MRPRFINPNIEATGRDYAKCTLCGIFSKVFCQIFLMSHMADYNGKTDGKKNEDLTLTRPSLNAQVIVVSFTGMRLLSSVQNVL